jgi:hypothetical protein
MNSQYVSLNKYHHPFYSIDSPTLQLMWDTRWTLSNGILQKRIQIPWIIPLSFAMFVYSVLSAFPLRLNHRPSGNDWLLVINLWTLVTEPATEKIRCIASSANIHYVSTSSASEHDIEKLFGDVKAVWQDFRNSLKKPRHNHNRLRRSHIIDVRRSDWWQSHNRNCVNKSHEKGLKHQFGSKNGESFRVTLIDMWGMRQRLMEFSLIY